MGHRRTPCGADQTLAGPDGRCALPVVPLSTRIAVRAAGSAPCQAEWLAPRAGATMGRWPTVLGVSHLLASAQAGPILSRGGVNPSSQVPCRRTSVGVRVLSTACTILTLAAPVSPPPPPSAPLLGSVSTPPCPASSFPVAPCFGRVRCWCVGSRHRLSARPSCGLWLCCGPYRRGWVFFFSWLAS